MRTTPTPAEKTIENDPKFRRAVQRREARAARRDAIARHVADRWHHTVHTCYLSAAADWERGDAAREVVTWPYRGRCKKYPKKWVNPAYQIDRRNRVSIHGVRNYSATLPPIPAALMRAADINAAHPVGLLACKTNIDGVTVAYGVVGGAWTALAFCVRGVAIPESAARRTHTLADCLAEGNQEARAVMLDRLPDAERDALPVVDAEHIEHADHTELVELVGERHTALWVRVRNATIADDGTQKIHLLRVPPHMRSAREALAWTFGETGEAYRLAAAS